MKRLTKELLMSEIALALLQRFLRFGEAAQTTRRSESACVKRPELVGRSINKRTLFGYLLLAAVSLPVSGSAATVGQQFRDILADIDAQCRKEKKGPYLDKNDPDYGNKRGNTDCDILTIKPDDPLATEEGRFAYAIKLPPPHDQPKVQYQPGMNAEAFFKELCEKEAGDFVLRTADGVRGIKIMRPLPRETGVPLWNESGGPPPGNFVAVVNGIYQYVDAIELVPGSQTDTQLIHYAVDPKLSPTVPPWGVGHHPVEASNARYGFTFRNSPLENRELGIRGRELIVMDFATQEILGFRRMFSKLDFITRQSAKLMQGTPCRPLPAKDSDNRFIAKILKPATQVKGDAE